ncbi:hypothetical protein EFBL_1163 [Effusibacillus lacus]|uniref:Uncharacterized protein n=2 Tax=Effusibacillus lacus TaxID=1348429 RepID=A0A292YKV3_9BACL|nr:hypothetical protein EFBL_1163 [Effusibacillus lacus]
MTITSTYMTRSVSFSGTDIQKNSYSWNLSVDGDNNNDGTLYLNNFNWYRGSSSPKQLFFGITWLVDSVNENNTFPISNVYGVALNSSLNVKVNDPWTPGWQENAYPYMEQYIGVGQQTKDGYQVQNTAVDSVVFIAY